VIVGLGTAIWETLKSAWATVKEKWNEFKDEAGGDIWGGIKEGIANAAIAIYEFVRDKVVKPFIDGFKKAFGIASPSTVMEEQGGFIIDGLKEGIKDAWSNIGDWFDENVKQPVSEWFTGLWDDIKKWAEDAWSGITDAWSGAETWFSDNVTEPLKGWFTDAWDNIKGFANTAWTDIEETWSTVSTWFDTNVTQPVKGFFDTAWTDITGFFTTAWINIQTAWNTVATWFDTNIITPISTAFDTAWTTISTLVTGVWTAIETAWQNANNWFQDNILTPIETAFTTVWDNIKIAAETAFSTVADVIKGALNGVIGVLNSMLDFAFGGINELITKINNVGSLVPGWKDIPTITIPQIKYLASGAVIPPNAPFMAVMGDQRRGTNIEAPEALIRQIVREEAGGMGGGNITITFGGTMGELVRQLKPHIERETNRAGGSMLAKAVRA
jgi:hypothetical protein